MINNYETSSVGAASSGSSINDNSSTDKPLPIFLQVGTPVSAKYRGAFCEASVEKQNIIVDKNNYIAGPIDVNSVISIKWPLSAKESLSDSNSKKNAIVQKVVDQSTYTVVFDDGDKRCLKRTQLVIKGARHFKEGESLDQLPLTNPEHFKQPVINKKIYKSQFEDISETEESEMKTIVEVSVCEAKDDIKENEEDSKFHQVLTEYPHLKKYIGRVVMVDMPINVKGNDSLSSSGLLSDQSSTNLNDSNTTSRRRRGPALVCIPSADPGKISKTSGNETLYEDDSGSRTSKSNSVLVRFFKDGKFCVVPINYAQILNRYNIVDLAHQNSANQQVAFERAILWYDRHQLPIHWLSVSGNAKSIECSYDQLVETHLGTLNWRKILKTIKLKEKADLSQKKDNKLPKNPVSSSSANLTSRNRKKSFSESKKQARKNSKSKNKRSDSGKSNNKSISSDEDSDEDGNSDEERKPFKKKKIKTDLSSSENEGKKNKSRIKLESENESESSSDDFLESTESSSSDDEYLDNSGNEKPMNHKTVSSSEPINTNAPSSGVVAENFEAKDRWIANLYRFMEERGTPINKAPSIGNKDLDLYRLHKIVLNYGGFQRVTNHMQWITIFSKLNLPPTFTAGPKHLQAAYKKYLYPLDDLNRKLGASLDTSLVSSTGRRSHNSGNTNTNNNASSNQQSPQQSQRSEEKRTSESIEKCITLPIVEPISSSGSIVSNKQKSGENQLTTPSPPHLTAESPIKTLHSTSYCPSTLSSTPNMNNPEDSSPNFSGSDPKSFDSYQPENISDVSRIMSPIKKIKSEDVEIRKQRKRKKTDCIPDELATPIKNIRKECHSTPNKLKTRSDCSGSPPSLKIENSQQTKSDSSKGPKRSLHSMDFISEPSSLNTSLLDICQNTFDKNRIIPVGSKVFVRFAEKFYPAKVMRLINRNHLDLRKTKELKGDNLIDFLESTNPSDIDYKVHYSGWNTRHDEIVDRERIVKVIEWAPHINRPPSSSSMNFDSCGCMNEGDFDLKINDDFDKSSKKYSESDKGCEFRIGEDIEEEIINQETMSVTSNTPSTCSSTNQLSKKKMMNSQSKEPSEPIEISVESESKVDVKQEQPDSDNESVPVKQEAPVKRKAGRPRKTNKFVGELAYTRKVACDQHQLMMMMSEEDTASDIVTTSAVPVFRNNRGRNPKLYGKFNRISHAVKTLQRKTDGDSDSKGSNITSSSGRIPRPRGRPPGKSRNMTKTCRRDDRLKSNGKESRNIDESDSESKFRQTSRKGYYQAVDSDCESRESEDSDDNESDRIDENGDIFPRLTRRQHKILLGDENDRSDANATESCDERPQKSAKLSYSSDRKRSYSGTEGQNDLDNTVEAVLNHSRLTGNASNSIMRKSPDSDCEDHLSPMAGNRPVKEDDLTSLGSTIGMHNPYDIGMAKEDIENEKKTMKYNVPSSWRNSIGSLSSNTSLDENTLEDNLNGNVKNIEILSPANTADSSNAMSAEENPIFKDRTTKTSESEKSTVTSKHGGKRSSRRSKADIKSEVNSIESYQSSDNESRTNDLAENIGSPPNPTQRLKDKQIGYSCYSPKPNESNRSNATVSSCEYSNLHGPFIRRFGGPYFPITGLKNLSSEEKCQALQVRMRQILDAWRLAKQFQKDLDPRASRSKRNRAAIQLLSIGHGKSPFNQISDNQIPFS